MLTFFIAGLLFICALSTSITWQRTAFRRRPVFSSYLVSTVTALRAYECLLWARTPKVFSFEQRIVPAICMIAILRTSDGVAMTFKGCHSDRQSGFNGEIAIHFADSKQTTLDATKKYGRAAAALEARPDWQRARVVPNTSR